MSHSQHFGKYRAIVIANVDPLGLGRIRAEAPDLGATSLLNWAMPCVPVAGPGAGMLAIPPVGASIWLEFERGDLDFPIWVGGFWTDGAQLPGDGAPLPGSFSLTLQTPGGNRIHVSDDPGEAGGIMLATASGATLAINGNHIRIANGAGASIELAGPTVTINGGALEVS